MLTLKQVERITATFTSAINKHGDSLRSAEWVWTVVELYDTRYPDSLIQEAVPWVRLDFK